MKNVEESTSLEKLVSILIKLATNDWKLKTATRQLYDWKSMMIMI